MKSILLIVVALFGTFLIMAGVLGFVLAGMYNNEVSLQTTYEAKIDANRGELDNVKKKISQVAQVSQGQLEQLDKLYTDVAEGRTGQGGGKSIVSWVKESMPNIDQSMGNKIINIITSSRDAWTSRQTELVDISREYNNNLARFPGNVILPLFGFKHIDPKVITSSSTENAFQTGKDDDTDVFQKSR